MRVTRTSKKIEICTYFTVILEGDVIYFPTFTSYKSVLMKYATWLSSDECPPQNFGCSINSVTYKKIIGSWIHANKTVYPGNTETFV